MGVPFVVLESLESRTLLASVSVNTNAPLQTIESLGGNYSKAPFYDTATDATTQFTLTNLHPKIARVPLLLKDWEPTNDAFKDTAKVHELFLLMQQFESRGMTIMGSVYDVPDWMVSNPTALDHRAIPAANYGELTESIATLLTRARDVYGVSLDYLSFNESNGGYSILLSAQEQASIISIAGGKLAAGGFIPKWLVGDTFQVKGTVEYAKAILDNAGAKPYLGPIAFHTWWSESVADSDWTAIRDLGKQYGKSVWASEVGYDATAWFKTPWIFSTWQNARRIARMYHKSLALAGATTALYWQYQDDFPLISPDQTTKYPAYYVVKNLVENLAPGTRVVTANSDNSSILALASRNLGTNKFFAQAINTATSAQSVTFTGLPNTPLTLVRNSLTERNVTIGTYTPVNGALTLNLPADSISILTGKLTASVTWSDRDIGSAGLVGSSTRSGSSFTVKGAGADIFNTADSFHFTYQTLTGDGQIVARVASMTNTNSYAKAGVMMRESLASNAKEASAVVMPIKKVSFLRRTSVGGATSSTSNTGYTTPVWLKLVRRGNVFSSYRSTDGSSWTLVGSATISMGQTIYVGLAVTSHNTSLLNSSSFTNVSVTKL